MGKFKHHKYIYSSPMSYARHNWELVGPDGGITFHFTEVKGYETTAGLEFHHTTGEGAPDHCPCPLLGRPCWHDGTSLYATETVLPLVMFYLKKSDHKEIFQILEREYAIHFERGDI
jgi:hypothetical protein